MIDSDLLPITRKQRVHMSVCVPLAVLGCILCTMQLIG